MEILILGWIIDATRNCYIDHFKKFALPNKTIEKRRKEKWFFIKQAAYPTSKRFL